MIAWLAARSDFPRYSEMAVYDWEAFGRAMEELQQRLEAVEE